MCIEDTNGLLQKENIPVTWTKIVTFWKREFGPIVSGVMFLLELSCFTFSSCMEIVEAHVYNLESSLIVTMFITNSAEVWVFQGPVRYKNLHPSSMLYRFWEVKNMPPENCNLHSTWLNVTSVWLFGFYIKCICKLLHYTVQTCLFSSVLPLLINSSPSVQLLLISPTAKWIFQLL